MSPSAMRGTRPRPGEPSRSPGPLTFAAVNGEHAATVARWAARLGGPAADVEDITQEVFLVVNRRLADFRGDGRVSTWLFGITAKIAANERRRRKLRHWWLRLVPARRRASGARRRRARAAGRNASGACCFHRALDRLSERHRRALVLFELEEMSVDDVAAHMGLRPGKRPRGCCTGRALRSSRAWSAASWRRS
jgi:RNA polymerase sigma-70 factor (ECF subfamily)